jgi:hypothetical protein
MIVEKKRNRPVYKKQALARSLTELSCCIKQHCHLVHAVLGTDIGEPEITCTCGSECHFRQELKTTLIETIHILEGTRKNFKSKQIESLRKNLTEKLVKI